jgi:hypothetical protein
MHRKQVIIKLQVQLRAEWLKLLPLREKKEYLEGVLHEAQSAQNYAKAHHARRQVELSGLEAQETRVKEKARECDERWVELEQSRKALEMFSGKMESAMQKCISEQKWADAQELKDKIDEIAEAFRWLQRLRRPREVEAEARSAHKHQSGRKERVRLKIELEYREEPTAKELSLMSPAKAQLLSDRARKQEKRIRPKEKPSVWASMQDKEAAHTTGVICYKMVALCKGEYVSICDGSTVFHMHKLSECSNDGGKGGDYFAALTPEQAKKSQLPPDSKLLLCDRVLLACEASGRVVHKGKELITANELTPLDTLATGKRVFQKVLKGTQREQGKWVWQWTSANQMLALSASKQSTHAEDEDEDEDENEDDCDGGAAEEIAVHKEAGRVERRLMRQSWELLQRVGVVSNSPAPLYRAWLQLIPLRTRQTKQAAALQKEVAAQNYKRAAVLHENMRLEELEQAEQTMQSAQRVLEECIDSFSALKLELRKVKLALDSHRQRCVHLSDWCAAERLKGKIADVAASLESLEALPLPSQVEEAATTTVELGIAGREKERRAKVARNRLVVEAAMHALYAVLAARWKEPRYEKYLCRLEKEEGEQGVVGKLYEAMEQDEELTEAEVKALREEADKLNKCNREFLGCELEQLDRHQAHEAAETLRFERRDSAEQRKEAKARQYTACCRCSSEGYALFESDGHAHRHPQGCRWSTPPNPWPWPPIFSFGSGFKCAPLEVKCNCKPKWRAELPPTAEAEETSTLLPS